VDNIKVDLREVGWDGMDCIDLAQDRDHRKALSTCMSHLQVVKKFRTKLVDCTGIYVVLFKRGLRFL
jgi:hypothetical protein